MPDDLGFEVLFDKIRTHELASSLAIPVARSARSPRRRAGSLIRTAETAEGSPAADAAAGRLRSDRRRQSLGNTEADRVRVLSDRARFGAQRRGESFYFALENLLLIFAKCVEWAIH